jgi:type I restriction enzyme S subunit
MAAKKLNKTNVPNLRFKEFEGEWVERKLSEVTKKINSGKTPLGGESAYTNQGIPFIRSQNVNNNKLEIASVAFISNEMNEQMKNSIVNANDILLNITGASLGRSCVVPKDFKEGNVNQHVCIIRFNLEYNPRFVQPIFSSTKGQEIFVSLQTGSGREGLTFESIKGIKLKFPSKAEQDKIANFVSLLEDRIATQIKIIERLETLIKGMRGKLLSGELRFKDIKGKNFAKWEKKRLGEVAVKKSSNIAANKIEENIGDYIIYGASGILKRVDFYEEDNDYISIVKDGAGVGRIFYCAGKSSVLGTMEIIKPQDELNSYFLFCVLSNIDFAKYISGSTIPHIYFKDYSNETCFIPCLEEQTKIANFLWAINEKIARERKLHQQYEWQKKYLLQNMFI